MTALQLISFLLLVISPLALFQIWQKVDLSCLSDKKITSTTSAIGLKEILLSFFSFFLALFLSFPALSFLQNTSLLKGEKMTEQEAKVLVLFLSGVFALIFFIAVLFFLSKEKRATILRSAKTSHVKRDLLQGAYLGFASLTLMILIFYGADLFLKLFKVKTEAIDTIYTLVTQNVERRAFLFLAVINSLIILPVIEECYIRGCVQNFLTARWGIFRGIMATAITFVFFSVSGFESSLSLTSAFGLFVLSLLASLTYEYVNSLYAAISFRITQNAFMFFVCYSFS